MKRLFVAIPYGVRRGLLDEEVEAPVVEIDFDKVWTEMLQPAVPNGFDTKRADELHQPGLIDQLYNEWLFGADIVLADLTFRNPNVYYELGIRQALSKKGTVLIACRGTRPPFDVRNQYVLFYDYFAAPGLRQFQAQLRQAIENGATHEIDSPVHVFLPGLFVARYDSGLSPETQIKRLQDKVDQLEATLRDQQSLDLEQRFLRKIQEANTASEILRLNSEISRTEKPSIDTLESLAIQLRKHGRIEEAIQTLDRALNLKPDDPDLLREIGFAYRKKGPDFFGKAEEYMGRALQLNDTDAELHGMIGGLLKRRERYQEALAHYQRAYELDPGGLYPLVNLGAMHAALNEFPAARNWYGVVRSTCRELIESGKADYWTYLCLGEAEVAAGDEVAAIAAFGKARELGVPEGDFHSAIEQLEFLSKVMFAKDPAEKVLLAVKPTDGHT